MEASQNMAEPVLATLKIEEVALERLSAGQPCGSLRYRLGERRAHALWCMDPRVGPHHVDFLVGLGAHGEDFRKHKEAFVAAVEAEAFARTPRKRLHLT